MSVVLVSVKNVEFPLYVFFAKAIIIYERVFNIEALLYCGMKMVQNDCTWYLTFHTGRPTIFQPDTTIMRFYKTSTPRLSSFVIFCFDCFCI